MPLLPEFSSALQLPKKTGCSQYERSWMTDRENSLSSSCCHSQKTFSFICSWERLQDCLHAHCGACKTKTADHRSFCSILTLILCIWFNYNTYTMNRDNILAIFPGLRLPSVLARSFVSMQIIMQYLTELLFRHYHLSSQKSISLTWKHHMQIWSIYADCSKANVWVTLSQLECKEGYLHIYSLACAYTLYKKLSHMPSKDIVGATPMHEHLSSLFPSFTSLFIHTAYIYKPVFGIFCIPITNISYDFKDNSFTGVKA